MFLDLGIDIENIKNKTLSVLMFKKCDEKFIKEADMSGPLLFALIFGSLLMLVHYIFFEKFKIFDVFFWLRVVKYILGIFMDLEFLDV